MKTLTVKLLEDLSACREGVLLVKNSNLEGFPLEKLNEVKGDYRGFVSWLKHELKHTYIEYDNNNNTVSEKMFDSEGNVEWCYEYSYDNNNNMLSEKELDSEGNVKWCYEYSYDNNNNMVSEKMFDSKGNVKCCYEYSYDNNNNMVSKKRFDSEGNVEWCYEYHTEYFDNGQLHKIIDCKSSEVLLEIPKF